MMCPTPARRAAVARFCVEDVLVPVPGGAVHDHVHAIDGSVDASVGEQVTL
jgi:hypothetical protein